MGLRDLFQRLTGRQAREGYPGGGRPRHRSERTVQLGGPVEARPRAVPAKPAQPEPPPRPRSPSQPTPAPAPRAASPADAPTVYQGDERPRDEVTGVLAVVDGELKGRIYALHDGENTVGRAESSDVVLPSKWVSRQHALLIHQDGVFAIVPQSERNRTLVNDVEVDGAELGDGDLIRMGRSTLRFRTIEGP